MFLFEKVKHNSPYIGHVGPEGSRYIALLFLQPRRWMGVGGQREASAALPPGKNRCPLYRRLGGHRAGLDGCRNSRSPAGFDSPDRQPVASHYTD